MANNLHIKEIDSIRGFAVLGVLLFHAGISLFSGGYAGVDVFFVLSGFLVSESIIRVMNNGKFCFVDFYLRRFKRIYPAAITTLFLALIFGQMIQLPDELIELKNSAFSFFTLSTEYWASDSINYFGIAVEFKPLIHYWSLAIELKYYLITPLFLFIGYRCCSSKQLFFISIGFLLFICIQVFYVTSIHPSDYYFSFFARSWQFFLGVCICLYINAFKFDWVKVLGNRIFLVLGYLIILFSYLFFDSESNFPGLLSLVPCLGACILILNAKANKDRRLGMFMTLLSWLGVISFSLYLLHQPIFAYYKLLLGKSINVDGILISILASVIISAFLYYFVERRFNSYSISSKSTYVYCLCLSLFSVYLIFIHDNKLGPDSKEYVAFRHENNPRINECRVTNKIINPDTLCRYGNFETGNRKFFLWGDSHADQLVLPLSESLTPYGAGIEEAAIAGCPPILNYVSSNPKRKCEENNKLIYNYLINQPHITDVILHAFWIGYFDNDIGSKSNNMDELLVSFSDMIKKLESNGKAVHVMYQIPQLEIDPPLYLARRAFLDSYFSMQLPTLTMEDFESKSLLSTQFLDLALSNVSINAIYPSQLLYDKEKDDFTFIYDGRILYRDNNHLSLSGGRYISDKIAERLIEYQHQD
ncbi:acyltransferase family protein [Vibrio sp. TRT 21S02]|uniref:acyltransferase family protein n=1 Tax=Vibrio sp. TRT 21S02 TaxID=3418507 RepID=UPI003CEF3255